MMSIGHSTSLANEYLLNTFVSYKGYFTSTFYNNHIHGVHLHLGETHKLIGNILPLSAMVGKIKSDVSSWDIFNFRVQFTALKPQI